MSRPPHPPPDPHAARPDGGAATHAEDPVLVEGRTCWRIARATRASVLIDAAAYFAALAAACERAERSILMVGWDFHSRVRLRRGGASDGESELARFLDGLVRRRASLEVHALGWDFAAIYALERETLPLLRLGLRTHGRIHFHLDDRHPLGGSQHQKIVVVDDRVAFCGGLDLTACRWDTREHAADEPERQDPGFGRYGPFHDVQWIVEGEVAALLGGLVRERWQRAVGRRLRATEAKSDPWPEGLDADFENVCMGIARTQPDHEDWPEVREVEAQYEAAFRAARRSIYIENQYLSAASPVRVLAERLAEPDGPEVVVVLPASSGGWLEEATMGVRRSQLLQELRQADRHDRLRVFHPHVPDVDDAEFTVHAKLLVVDDRLLRIGSSNLSNRSMGLDSECDLSIEAGDADAELQRRIRRVRESLLAEHLDATPDDVAAACRSAGSLVGAVEALRGEGRSLRPLEPAPESWLAPLLSESELLDPERPIEAEQWLRERGWRDEGDLPATLLRRLATTAVAVGLLVAFVRATSPDAWETGPIAAVAGWVTGHPLLGVSAAALATAVVTLVALPVSWTCVVAALLLPTPHAILAVLLGALAALPAGYLLGRSLWRDTVRALAGRELNRLTRQLARADWTSAALLRNATPAAFGTVNLVAGASRVPFRGFVVGSLVGVVPGIAVGVAWSRAAWRVALEPEPAAAAAVVAVGLVLWLLGRLLRTRLVRRWEARAD